MSLDIAKQSVVSLVGTQKARFEQHLQRENTPSGKKVFDKKMKEFLFSIKSDGFDLDKTIKYLDKIGFGQDIYEPDKVVELFKSFEGIGHPNNSGLLSFRHAKDKLKAYVHDSVRQNPSAFKQYAPLSYANEEEIVGALPKLQSHAGIDAFLYGLHKKGDFIGKLLDTYTEREAKARIDKTFGSVAIPLHRTQAGDPFDEENLIDGEFIKFKSRGVQAIGTMQTLAERKFSLPFTKWMATEGWYAGGYNQNEMLSIINERRRKYPWWMSIDFEKFDSTIPKWLVLAAFDIVKEFFLALDEYCWHENRFDAELFDIVKRDFVHMLIIAPNGEFVESHHGIKSGSSFTQIIGTICNYLMVTTYLEKKGEDYEVLGMGDDNIIFIQSPVDISHLRDMAAYCLSVFGCTISPGKSSFGASSKRHPEFLSREWRRDGCYRDPRVLLAKLLFPERFREYERLGYTPEEVVHQYMAEFGLGMNELISVRKLGRLRQAERYRVSGTQFAVTGSERVRQIVNATKGRKLADVGYERILLTTSA